VVNVASTAGLAGYPYVAAYVAAKHGVVGLTRALALEFARTRVTVNAVCPGYTETELLGGSIATVMEKSGRTEAEVRAQFTRGNPQGRLVAPDEVAAAVAFLCGPGSDAINGQAIAVAGGEVMP
jgi:NAD(P)-dependent dehydrogenase (short-subunit alcohol dehydrogenase family)